MPKDILTVLKLLLKNTKINNWLIKTVDWNHLDSNKEYFNRFKKINLNLLDSVTINKRVF